MNYTEVKRNIDELIEKAELYGKLSSDQLNKLHHKFRLEWNYNSNSMEGNTLTVAETRHVMAGVVGGAIKPMKDVLEVKGHDEVISDILRIGKAELRLSEKRIREIHIAIMYEDNPQLKEKIGNWKTEANEIINLKGEKYLFVLPEEVPEQIHDLLNRTNAAIDRLERGQKDTPHPIDIALNFHIEYLNIHPFYDGNGRTARILSNLILVALGYPPFWITDQEREVYYRYIADIQCYGGKKEDLFTFLGGLILRSQQLINDVQAGKSIEEADDIDKEIELLKRELKAKEQLEENTKLDKVIQKNYTEEIEPLFRIVEKNLKKYTELFESITFSYSYVFKSVITKELSGFVSNSTYTTVEMGIDLEKTSSMVEWWRDIHCIKLELGLEKLRLIKIDELIDVELVCMFSSSGYEINVDKNTKFSKFYTQGITAEEQIELIREINLIILDKIKELQREEKE